MLGNDWKGIVPAFTDEGVYYAHIHAIGDGYLSDGNPFFFEHRNGPPLVIFGGAWINALPLWAGIPFTVAVFLNFIIWSLAFAAVLYWLFREWRIPRWISVGGTLFIYLQSYAHVWRSVNLQPVYPFYFLFYVALSRLIREQTRNNIALLALATAATFYVFAYAWQIAVITLGLLFWYALISRNTPLLKATLISSGVGGIIGLPIPLYMLWLSHASPFFWESMGRLGLVNTHIPTSEIIYSGGWIVLLLLLLTVLFVTARTLWKETTFGNFAVFTFLSGFGLWIMEGSNLITGKQLETGEHVRTLILPWLAFITITIGVYLWERRNELSQSVRVLSVLIIVSCAGASLYFFNLYFVPFVQVSMKSEFWHTEQLYAAPFAWLNQHESSPVVVWSDPSDSIASTLPAFTRHYSLYTSAGLSTLVSENEIRERFLISQYFNNPTVDDLKSDADMSLYLGRHDFPHEAKTIERRIKVCRIIYFWNSHKECGTPPTPQELLGDQFFSDLETKFKTDIKPNIKAYLKKYQVSYILKDTVLDPEYKPEKLGAERVYSDGRFEIYHLP